MLLKSKNVVITGAGSGIGKAIAKTALDLGANILISCKNKADLMLAANELNCDYQICDVREESQIESLVKRAESSLGGIDLFCSNAGVFYAENGGVASLDNKCWDESLQVNLMAHVYAARYVLPGMLKKKSGYFLQIVSAAALLSQVGATAYSATKSAALSFAESLAISHGQSGIKVSAVCSQYIATPMLGFVDTEADF